MFGFFDDKSLPSEGDDIRAIISRATDIGRSWQMRVSKNEEVAHELGNLITTRVNELVDSDFVGKDGFDRAIFVSGLLQGMAKLLMDDVLAIAKLNTYDDDNQEVSNPKNEIAAAMAFVQMVSSYILSESLQQYVQTMEKKELDASEIVAQIDQFFGGTASQ